MMWVDAIVSYHRERDAFKGGWAAWAKLFPEKNEVLLDCMRAAHHGD